MEITPKDEQLIALLRENGRLPVSELARRMAASRTAVQMRLKKLERRGVIAGYSVTLSPEYDGKTLRALVMIRFPPGKRQGIEAALAAIPQLTTLYSISGTFDMAGVVSARSMEDLDRTIDEIGLIEGIDETMSSIILSTKISR
jgi:DNA-binding Lrp family transcriptional regulator